MSYTEGRQPCDRFDAQITGNQYATWANVHECVGPYPHVAGEDRCAGRVSFCANCTTDHHDGGWDTCPTAPVPEYA